MMRSIFKNLLIASFLFGASSQASKGNPEEVLGYVTDEVGIIFQVQSGGCTDRSSFFVQQRKSLSMRILNLVRVRPDTCLALFPYGVKVRFSYDELGIEPNEKFKIENKLSLLSR